MNKEDASARLLAYQVGQRGLSTQLFAILFVGLLAISIGGTLFLASAKVGHHLVGPLGALSDKQFGLGSVAFICFSILFSIFFPLLFATTRISYAFSPEGFTEVCGYCNGLIRVERRRKWEALRFWWTDTPAGRTRFDLYFRGASSIRISKKDKNDILCRGVAVDWHDFSTDFDTFLKTQCERGYPKSVLFNDTVRLIAIVGFIILTLLAFAIAFITPVAVFFMNIINNVF